ncbi:MAG: deoxyguanosinetriphosphate triphosphohydrolase [Desulfurivibrionaceae bacterium]|jgi:dGTPase|nr:deoxyguanosinetriphosphate triphosphohydrolase [Pseudomonadota bacterium]MCG2823020.1 deoxyguanosinetriphosphate triphosphohydrolase [Desulfobulbaceae bacterium]MDP2002493.1 deoxyguanosinetriphosphate triphosphohydrolase [Desulfurivibrionaceae bacterium]PKN21705.1 MAG: deoxyguanosinetriphosphate triphosphohydrolase [Deltaproteobacteria bacterium HGW-Deltaproteobacteria-3]MBU4230406.1 deoxyguanosinetriphosphate triphosphohydrolase [Pseudomonadota bacterium]
MDHSIRLQIEEREAASLAPYAALSRNTKGRFRPEEECPIRGAFQRDRDRIIHCKSFRRLKHKTQVFLAPTGDHYRTRLTHVLEVSQIARTISVALRLNGHLTEAIALGHDLGHTPFGHAGEAVLDELYPQGFRHYDQSLRVVNILEKKGEGLNLTVEVLDGIAKHSKGRREILPLDISELPATMEGRVVRIADIIAYVNHDLDDAVRAGILSESQIPSHLQKLFGPSHSGRICTMVNDLVVQTLKNGGETLAMSPILLEGIAELRSFLYENVYETNRVHDDFIKAKKVLRELYEYFITKDDHWERVIDYDEATPREQMVCDFIAGMTDRYALDLYTNIFLPKPWSVM